MRSRALALIPLFLLTLLPGRASAADCTTCHAKKTPGIVSDWKLSKHSGAGVGCEDCHGSAHTSAADVAKATLPTPETCKGCHETQTEQFMKGKHAAAWAAMNAMPTIHYQPMVQIEGQKGCGGCHDVGAKSEADRKALAKVGVRHGGNACVSCHTRHLFSKEEARSPEACRTCHTGFDHPQWEMWSASKHGVRHDLRTKGVISESAAGPTCQDCHMSGGNHEVRTAWGFLAVRLPLPEDPQWKADQVTILQGLGVLDPEGKPTGRLDAVKAADVARLTQEAFDAERNRMIDTCSRCHARSFAEGELKKGDEMIREADHLMAEGIREVAGLYRDGVLTPPKGQAAFPDLLTFHDAPTTIEQTLFVMFLEHRMRAFQGAFHNNPDYSMWYGWSEMKRDLTEIREEAARLRAEHAAEAKR